jgi:hypothetical protein
MNGQVSILCLSQHWTPPALTTYSYINIKHILLKTPSSISKQDDPHLTSSPHAVPSALALSNNHNRTHTPAQNLQTFQKDLKTLKLSKRSQTLQTSQKLPTPANKSQPPFIPDTHDKDTPPSRRRTAESPTARTRTLHHHAGDASPHILE